MSIQLRNPTQDDLVRFKQCLSTDPDHAKQGIDSWTSAPGEFMTFYDANGNRVWVRIERVLRVHFQHDPETPRKELAYLIYRGLYFVIKSAKRNEFCEVIFESRSTSLIRFIQKLFGFKPVESNYYVRP